MTTNALKNETVAASNIREDLREIIGDDASLLRDTIEGETSLFELIESCVAEIQHDAAIIDGIKRLKSDLDARKERIENRVGMMRAAIQGAMGVAELKTLECHAGTVTIKAVPPGVTITDESAIPADFWKAQDPKLDKQAVKNALKDGQTVAGATLTNGGETIQIRVN